MGKYGEIRGEDSLSTAMSFSPLRISGGGVPGARFLPSKGEEGG